MTSREPRPDRRVQVRRVHVHGPSGVADLTVAADVPVRDLLSHLAAALSTTSPTGWSLQLVRSQRVSGAPPRPIPDDETLAAAGVVHGDGLELVPRQATRAAG